MRCIIQVLLAAEMTIAAVEQIAGGILFVIYIRIINYMAHKEKVKGVFFLNQLAHAHLVLHAGEVGPPQQLVDGVAVRQLVLLQHAVVPHLVDVEKEDDSRFMVWVLRLLLHLPVHDVHAVNQGESCQLQPVSVAQVLPVFNKFLHFQTLNMKLISSRI